MKFLLSSALVLLVSYVGVESVKMREVSLSRRSFDAHRAKRKIITLRDIEDELHLGEKVTLKPKGKSFHSTKGVDRQRLAEFYGGLEVVGPHAEAEYEDGLETGHIYGDLTDDVSLHEDIPNPDACQQDEKEMINIAIKAEGLDPKNKKIQGRKATRKIYISPRDSKAYIVYFCEFGLITEDTQTLPTYIMNACDKSVIAHFDKIQEGTISLFGNKRQADDDCVEPTPEPLPASTCDNPAVGYGGNAKVGKVVYGVSPLCFDLGVSGNQCTMENDYVKVVNNHENGDFYGLKIQDPIVFKCDLGFHDAINEGYGIANDALYKGTKSILFFKETYGVDALPHKPRMVVHFGKNMENAFWDGRDMYFGDGLYRFYPLLDLDVVAHELAHGFTSTNSDLTYSAQSGGINEAFSDITGDTVSNWVYGNNDWLIGAEIGKSMTALRYMNDPPRDGRSIKHVDQYYDGMDVHYSSGVFNYAYYQLVEIQGMPIFHAFECFMEANLVRWGPSTNYQQGACGVVQACYDAGFDIQKVKTAFETTGITFDDCVDNAFETVLVAPHTRTIKISDVRRPIFKLDNAGLKVETTADDVQLDICADYNCQNIEKTSSQQMTTDEFTSGDHYLRVTSATSGDREVEVTYN